MRKREYSTRELDRILDERKYRSIYGSRRRRKKSSILADTMNYKLSDDIKGYLNAYTTKDTIDISDIGTFSEWLEANVDRYKLKQLSDDQLFRNYLPAYQEIINDKYDNLYNEVKYAVDDCNNELQIFKINIIRDRYEGFYLRIEQNAEDMWNIDERIFYKEKAKVNKMIVKLAKEFGLEIGKG